LFNGIQWGYLNINKKIKNFSKNGKSNREVRASAKYVMVVAKTLQ